jgi:hypothetical protein
LRRQFIPGRTVDTNRHGFGLPIRPCLSLPRLVSISSDPDGLRTNDNGVIAPAAKNLSDQQIEALANSLTSF